jgi:hypothetical protein
MLPVVSATLGATRCQRTRRWEGPERRGPGRGGNSPPEVAALRATGAIRHPESTAVTYDVRES